MHCVQREHLPIDCKHEGRWQGTTTPTPIASNAGILRTLSWRALVLTNEKACANCQPPTSGPGRTLLEVHGQFCNGQEALLGAFGEGHAPFSGVPGGGGGRPWWCSTLAGNELECRRTEPRRSQTVHSTPRTFQQLRL